jgi:hypothetical protein
MKLVKTLLAGVLLFSILLSLASCVEGELETETLDLTATATLEATEEVNPDEVSAMPLEEYRIAELSDYIKLLGDRTDFNDNGELVVEWSGSGFEIDINAGAEGTDLRLGVRCNYASRWSIFVDGMQWGEKVAITTGNKKQIVARGIPAGEHTIRVVKESQPNTNRNNYNNIISFSFNGELLDKDTSDKDLFLEFVGDGYFVGLGNVGKTKKATGTKILDETSFTKAIPYLTSQALDADYSVVAHSQIGIITKAGNFAIEELFGNQNAYRDLDQYYDPDRTPDAIILHVGMDDSTAAVADGGLPAGEFIIQGEMLINSLRDFYGSDVPVVWLYNTRFAATRASEIRAIAQRMGGAENGVYALESYFGNGGSGIDATGSYPSAAEHAEGAKILTEFLKEILGL